MDHSRIPRYLANLQFSPYNPRRSPRYVNINSAGLVPGASQLITRQRTYNRPVDRIALGRRLSRAERARTLQRILQVGAARTIQRAIRARLARHARIAAAKCEARLQEARLEEARLQEARLEEARLEEARLEEARSAEARLQEQLPVGQNNDDDDDDDDGDDDYFTPLVDNYPPERNSNGLQHNGLLEGYGHPDGLRMPGEVLRSAAADEDASMAEAERLSRMDMENGENSEALFVPDDGLNYSLAPRGAPPGAIVRPGVPTAPIVLGRTLATGEVVQLAAPAAAPVVTFAGMAPRPQPMVDDGSLPEYNPAVETSDQRVHSGVTGSRPIYGPLPLNNAVDPVHGQTRYDPNSPLIPWLQQTTPPKVRGPYYHTKIGKWWFRSVAWQNAAYTRENKPEIAKNKLANIAHAARIEETTLGQRCETKCELCRKGDFECNEYSPYAHSQMSKIGRSCSRCRMAGGSSHGCRRPGDANGTPTRNTGPRKRKAMTDGSPLGGRDDNDSAYEGSPSTAGRSESRGGSKL